MTEHRPAMRIDIRRATAPDGHPAVLIQFDDYHVLLWAPDAIEIAQTVTEIARGILAQRWN
jgi:hypothetical protein